MMPASTSNDAGRSAALDEGPAARPVREESPFDVPTWLHALGRLVHGHGDFWTWLGRLETATLAEELSRVEVKAPIYISGLARSGSTLLHQLVCSSAGVATHRMKDYPMVFTPYWWRLATGRRPPQPPRERPHRDGLMITPESPDAIEEMIWTAFFPRCHAASVSSVLGRADRHTAFESFYQAHLRKLLLAEGATRYAAKNNYHVARLAYLVRLFPDARFLIPVRAPAAHIASLLRQQRWFSAGQRQHPRALAIMQWSGHFEFGLDRRPIHLDDSACAQQVRADWAGGNEVRGLARYWSMIYSYLARLLASDDQVRAAAMVVRFETLCDAPAETLRAILKHCLLTQCDELSARRAATIRYPRYYQGSFSPADHETIEAETAAVARLWGY